MNPNRWFAWVCLALMLVSEVFLFRANHERDRARVACQTAQLQLQTAQQELEGLKNSSSGAQVAELAGLRKQNAVLTAKVAALQKNLEQIEAENAKTASHLTTARDALALQQEHLQELQTQQQQAAELANASACINNLRQLEAAKRQWALETSADLTNTPTAADLAPYLKDGVMPTCPDGGAYSINSMAEPPTCSVPGHVFPQ